MHRARILAGIVGLSLAFGPAIAQQLPLFDPDYRALIPAAQGMTLVSGSGGCSSMWSTLHGQHVTGTWDVTPAQADAAESYLAFNLVKAIQRTDWVAQNSFDYQKISNSALQFIGVVIGGKKYILIMGAPIFMYDFNGRTPYAYLTAGWREGKFALGMCDGGPEVFSVLYDLDEKTFGPVAFQGTLGGPVRAIENPGEPPHR